MNNEERIPRLFNLRTLALAGVIAVATGCTPMHEVTMTALPDPAAAHLVTGQHLLVVGPMKIKGAGPEADYLIVIPVQAQGAPQHTWALKPMIATRTPNTTNEYTLPAQVTNAEHPTGDLHTMTLKIAPGEPFKVDITGEPSIQHHGGTAHFEE